MRTIEPFEEFARLGRGVPFLQTSWHSRNAKTGHVHWHEGTLLDYAEFHAALDSDRLDAALWDLWQSNKSRCGWRAEFCAGITGGCMVYVPIGVATKAANIVRTHFTQTLHIVERWVDLGGIFRTSRPDRCDRGGSRRSRL